MAFTEEGRKVADIAAAARDVALKDAKDAKKRCRAAEAELQALRDEQATRTHRLEEQEEELKARETALADRDTELEQAAQE